MAAIEVQKFRVATLPVEAERVLGAEYWTRDGTTGELVIHTVGKDDKAVVTRTISRADVATMITEAKSDFGVTVAPLENGLVPTEYLPTYVDDVIEVSAYDELPGNVNANADHGPAEKGPAQRLDARYAPAAARPAPHRRARVHAALRAGARRPRRTHRPRQ